VKTSHLTRPPPLKDPAGTGFIEIIPMPKGDPTKLRDLSNAHVHIAFDVADMGTTAVAKLAAWPASRMEGAPTAMARVQAAFLPRSRRRADAARAAREASQVEVRRSPTRGAGSPSMPPRHSSTL
jgi:hypothetical protein